MLEKANEGSLFVFHFGFLGHNNLGKADKVGLDGGELFVGVPKAVKVLDEVSAFAAFVPLFGKADDFRSLVCLTLLGGENTMSRSDGKIVTGRHGSGGVVNDSFCCKDHRCDCGGVHE